VIGTRALGFRIPFTRRSVRRPDMATQWQLMWWRFLNHRMAMVGLFVVGLLFVIAIFAEIVSPYDPGKRNPAYKEGAPMGVHFLDAEGDFHLRPFVYARKAERDPVTLRMRHVVDTDERWPIRFFVEGNPYRLWGLIPMDTHLFGVPQGYVHLFGTDIVGLDLFSRTMHATRISLAVGVVGVSIAFVLGALIGGAAGYFGGWVDTIAMRTIDLIRSVPTLPLWLSLSAALPRDWSPLQAYAAVTLILAMFGWTWLARTVRSKLMALREEDFVTAARLAGCTNMRIILRHLLPSFLSYMIVDLTIAFPEILLAETALSFLGLGLREPVESWGVLLYSAQNIRAIAQMPWLLIPGLFVICAVLAFNFLGDGLRDAADPYAR
jgi:peptide/nickel transport system permease protein